MDDSRWPTVIVPVSLIFFSVPVSSWAFNPDVFTFTFDPARARRLLDEAGYTDTDGDGIREGECNGEPVKLEFSFETTDKQLRKDMAVAVQGMLAKIGVEFKPIFTPSGNPQSPVTNPPAHAT